MLRLAMAYGDEVVGLWRSPERSAEGWHQLIAYPGRVAEQFQVRYWYPGSVPASRGQRSRVMLREPRVSGRLVPSPASRRQLIFSLTQPPACGATLALDDIIFRNCGLRGGSRARWGEAGAAIPRDAGWGFAPRERSRCPLCLGAQGAGRAAKACPLKSVWRDVGGAQPRADGVSPRPRARAGGLRGRGEPLRPGLLPGAAPLLRRHRRLRGQLGRGRGTVR